MARSSIPAPPKLERTAMHTFNQIVLASDGSSFTIKTTSPRPLLTLTKDIKNSHLWIGGQAGLDSTSGALKKYQDRFGDIQDDSDQEFGFSMGAQKIKEKVVVVQEVKKQVKKKKK